MIYVAVALVCLGSCGRPSSASAEPDGDGMVTEAALLDIRDLHGSYLVTVRNPWDTTETLHAYHLVPRGGEDIPAVVGATRVTIPLERSIVYSGVHAGAIDELGGTVAVRGVADAQYFTLPAIRRGLAEGRIADVGNSMSPSVEKIVELSPDAILTSPYKNAGYGPLEQLAVPIIEMADYMEQTPLGRAEWIKFIGLLYGQYNRADSIFGSVVRGYNALRHAADSVAVRPKVITETLMSGVWMVPGGRSYKAQMLRDAGADYPWSDDTSSGSLQLDFPSVFERASDADFWITTTYGEPQTLASLQAAYKPNENFKAFRTGGVYNCDTSVKPLFEEFPFHPERLLADYMAIFHPETLPGYTLRYFRKVE